MINRRRCPFCRHISPTATFRDYAGLLGLDLFVIYACARPECQTLLRLRYDKLCSLNLRRKQD